MFFREQWEGGIGTPNVSINNHSVPHTNQLAKNYTARRRRHIVKCLYYAAANKMIHITFVPNLITPNEKFRKAYGQNASKDLCPFFWSWDPNRLSSYYVHSYMTENINDNNFETIWSEKQNKQGRRRNGDITKNNQRFTTQE